MDGERNCRKAEYLEPERMHGDPGRKEGENAEAKAEAAPRKPL